MRRSTTKIVVALFCLSIVGTVGLVGSASAAGCEYPVTETDATGAEVTITDEPQRIVTLNPSAAQTLWEVGAQEKVVGVSGFAAYLEGASERQTVTEIQGRSTVVLIEEVIALSPDLVLAPNTITNETVSGLRRANISVFRFRAATSIQDVYDKTERIGRLAGACEAAADTVAWMKEEIGIVREAVQGQDRPRVLYPMGSGFAPSPNTFIGGMIDAAGGHNIVADANATALYPQLSGEFVVQQDPDWYVVSTTAMTADQSARSLVPNSTALRNTTAWQEGQIVKVDANNISQPAPRIVYPIRKMAQAFHPDAYASAAATATPTPSSTASPSPTETSGQPGFGVPAVLVALLIVTVGLRRR